MKYKSVSAFEPNFETLSPIIFKLARLYNMAIVYSFYQLKYQKYLHLYRSAFLIVLSSTRHWTKQKPDMFLHRFEYINTIIKSHYNSSLSPFSPDFFFFSKLTWLIILLILSTFFVLTRLIIQI